MPEKLKKCIIFEKNLLNKKNQNFQLCSTLVVFIVVFFLKKMIHFILLQFFNIQSKLSQVKNFI